MLITNWSGWTAANGLPMKRNRTKYSLLTVLMMRLPKFAYRTPRTIAEAVKIIADTGPEAQFVAGGTDLYPNMKRRQQMPKTVISVMRLPELNQVTGDGAS